MSSACRDGVIIARHAAVAAVAAMPVLFSLVMIRGQEVSRLLVAFPLSVLAFAALRSGRPSGNASTAPFGERQSGYIVLALLACVAASTCLAPDPMAALVGEYGWREGALAWLVYGLLYLAAREGFVGAPRAPVARALALTLVVPLVMGFLQFAGLDVFPAGIDRTRFGATIGNPNTAAAVLAMLLPTCIVLAVRDREAGAVGRLLWWLLCAGSVLGLALTQSRGGWLAALAGLIVLGCAGTHAARRRWVIAYALGLTLAVAAVVVVVNAWAPARDLASASELAGRLVYRPAHAGSAATDASSTSIVMRLGLWEIGRRALLTSPPGRWLLGYGPDSAEEEYYRHVPPELMARGNYQDVIPFVRLDSESLDLILNLGLLPWALFATLFGVALLHGGRLLFGRSAHDAACLAAFVVGAGLLAGAAGWWLAGPMAALPGAAVGMGAGGTLHVAWQSIRSGASRQAVRDAGALHGAFLAGAIAYWIASQFNPMSMVSRALAMLLIALVLAPDRSEANETATPECADVDRLPIVAMSSSLAACCWTLLPPLADYSIVSGNERYALGRAILPILGSAAFFALWIAGARLSGIALSGPWRDVRSSLQVLLITACVFGFIGALAGTSIGESAAVLITSCVALLPFALVLSSLAAANSTVVSAPRAGVRQRWLAGSLLWAWSMVAALALAPVLYADVCGALAQWESQRGAPNAATWIDRATRWMPHERDYWRQGIQLRLGDVTREIRANGVTDANRGFLNGRLDAAETVGREALRRFPGDPWIAFAFANIRQAQSLSVFQTSERGLAPASLAAADANTYYAAAHAMFPAHPLILRNWAEHRIAEGRLQEGYALFERMIELIPGEVEPYRAFIAAARRIGDLDTVGRVVAQAGLKLDAVRFRELGVVAKLQQQ